MKILLDTCTFLWLITDDPQLSPKALSIFIDPDNDVYLSAVSTWEIAIKHAIGRLPLPGEPEDFIPLQRKQHSIEPLPLDEEAALFLPKLPQLHNDPFDRMLICQAIVEGMAILTPDKNISRYSIRVVW